MKINKFNNILSSQKDDRDKLNNLKATVSTFESISNDNIIKLISVYNNDNFKLEALKIIATHRIFDYDDIINVLKLIKWDENKLQAFNLFKKNICLDVKFLCDALSIFDLDINKFTFLKSIKIPTLTFEELIKILPYFNTDQAKYELIQLIHAKIKSNLNVNNISSLLKLFNDYQLFYSSCLLLGYSSDTINIYSDDLTGRITINGLTFNINDLLIGSSILINGTLVTRNLDGSLKIG